MNDLLNQAIDQALDLYNRKVGEGDLTVETLWPYPRHTVADLSATQDVPACVLPILDAIFKHGDPTLVVETESQGKTMFHTGEVAIRAEGNGRAILTGWQVAQSVVSLVASVYREVRSTADKLKAAGIDVTHSIDLPVGYDKLIGYATEAAGGMSIAAGLHEIIYLSRDHIAWVGSPREALGRTLQEVGDKRSLIKVLVEAREANHVAELLDAKVDWVYCRKFTAEEVRKAGKLTKGWVRLVVENDIPVEEVKTLRDAGVRLYAVNMNEFLASEELFSIRFENELAHVGALA